MDARLFIPKTAKNDERKQVVQSYQSLTNLERWFVQNSESGNRNNQLIKYALVLVDMGYDYGSIHTQVTGLNGKLDDKLTDKEINSTIMTSVNKAIGKRVVKAA